MFKRASSEFHSNLKPWRRSMTIAARKILFATLLPAITGFALFHGGNTFAEGGFTKADTHTHAWVNCYDATKSGGGVDTSGCAPA